MSDPYQRRSHSEIYRNPWLYVEVHQIVHPTGVAGEHLLVCTPVASGVLVVEGDDVILERQPRFGARSHQIEIVKGGADDGESPLGCAQRELREELGVTAQRWTPLGEAYEIPSIMDHPVTLFLAEELTFGATDPEQNERIDAVRMPLDAALDAAASGEISDAVTVTALFRYAHARSRRNF